jgi:eukaryotic-like serine/threonine-protein kinase
MARLRGSLSSVERNPGPKALLGKVIADKYKLRSILGSGGMGTVFEAQHVSIGRIVAIKILNPESNTHTAVKRFQQEAWAAGSIGHPNLCEVSDIGSLPDGRPYLVMERLLGQTLAERLDQERRLSIDVAIDVLMQMLAGLAAVHLKNIVHRDIKPENVFLSEHPGFPIITKLLDFGVSKVMASATDDWDDKSALTKTGVVMGTPYYVSPEQARAIRDLDARTDLYSCGVVLYEALTGELPYEAEHFHALLLRIVRGNPTPPTALRPEIPPELEKVVLTAMAVDRDARYPTASDMARALHAVTVVHSRR